MAGDGLDLFGEPIDARRGQTGRPRHRPTAATRVRVAELRGEGLDQLAIAKALGITAPTLRLNYPTELRSTSQVWRRRAQRDRQEQR